MQSERLEKQHRCAVLVLSGLGSLSTSVVSGVGTDGAVRALAALINYN